MNKTKRHTLRIVIVLLILINISVFIAFVAFHGSSFGKASQTHTVVLTKDGFKPELLTINSGDTVVFSTTAGREFWPASNLHPTHEIYPAFDPKIPIEPDKTWSFTFDKEGSWKLHDHMAPIFRGEIRVLGKSKEENNVLSGLSCNSITDQSERTQCIDAFFSYTLKEKGISGAFDMMDQLFTSDPRFSGSCHDFAHRLGEKAYDIFKADRKVVLSEKSSYCGYGFYHGFMEALLYYTGDIKEAQNFCDYAEKTLMEKNADAGGACYHGIGHGAVEDTPDPKVYGDAQKIIAPGLVLCKKVSPNTMKQFRCDTGVFNALEILMTNNRYNLSLNAKDPFWICKLQKDEQKEACYTQMVVAVMNVTNSDFYKSAEFIDSIPNDDYAIPTMNTLTIELVHTKKNDYRSALDFCHSLAGRFRPTCITSFAEGFMKYGQPKKEYVDAIRFCSSPLLSENDKKACFGRVLAVLRIWYTTQKSAEICKTVDQKYQYKGCRYK